MSKKSRKNIKILLVGSSGRMGMEIGKLIQKDSSLSLAGKVDSPQDWKSIGGSRPDLVIEFSSPEGCVETVRWCLENKVPLVSGTTGLTSAQKVKITAAAKKIPVLYSANMSLGIAVFNKMLETFAAIADWDFQIEEAHHRNKKDKPSGTALLLEEKLSKVLGRKLPPTSSIRGGGIAGIHNVWAMGPHEALVVQHTAFDRAVFAQGALAAARWLFDKKDAGLYDLGDLYG